MKKVISVFLAVLMLVTIFPLSVFAQDDILTYLKYGISNGEVTITDCDTSISGDITIPDTIEGYPVTTIGDEAFAYCYSLASITIPDSVTTIGDEAFCFCNIANITIPKNVTTIGELAFLYCHLSSITVDKNNANFSSDECGALFNKDKTQLIQYPTGNSRTEYTIPDSVTTVGNYAFYYCDSLASITIPDSVTTISDCAFNHCYSLASITIPDNVITLGDYAFAYCDSLASITIPDSVTTIGDSAFSHCDSLVSLIIPDRVASIGEIAFYHCNSLESITVDKNNTNYSSDEYGVLFNRDKTEMIQYPIGNCRKEYIIPDSVITIDAHTFSHCDNLTSITIPDSVTTIGGYAFTYCNSVASIIVDKNNANYSSDEYGVLFNKDKTEMIRYPTGNSRKEYAIPDSVTTINWFTFFDCGNLTDVTIPDSVTTIGEYAFSDCYRLTSITIPNSVTTIGYAAFDDCNSFETVYYSGTEEQWNGIDVGEYNVCLTNANIIFNYSGSDLSEPDSPVVGDSDVNIFEDLVFLDIGESFQFSAYDSDGTDITDSLTWQSSNASVAEIVSPGYVRAKSRGLITVSVEKSYEERDYCYIYVGEPNHIEYDTVYDTDYYYSDGGFYSNAAYISDTVDVYLSLKNSVADEMQSLYNKDVLLETYKDEFETLNLGEFTISATVSGNDLSFKKDSYSNSYSATYSGISIEQSVDELLMLYPYNLTASANKKSYTVTVKIESDDFETIEDTITFSVSDLASKAANEHIDYLDTNIPYKTSLLNSYGTNMVKLKDDPEYKWSKYTTFDFENYHQIVVADMLINMLNVAQLELPSLLPSVIKEYNDVQKEIVSTINTIVYDDYADAIDLTENAVDKLFKVSKYRKDGIYTEDVTFQLIQKILGNVSNAEKINKAFEVADKTKQVFKFVSFGTNAVKDVVNWCNKISVFNAYQDAGNALNEVFEKLYDTIPSSEVEMREAVADYINYADNGFTLTSEIIESIGELSVGITFDAAKTFLGKGFLEVISGSICNWIGSITLSSGATFATTAAFATVQAAFGGFVTGVAIGLCLTDFLCDSSGKSEEMSKIIAMSEYTPYIVETVKYYENNLYNNRNDYAVELFENAFAMHKASQSYVIEHTIKALEVKRDSIIEKLMNREDDYEGVIADTLVDKLQIDAMVCHSTDNNDTIVRKTKVIAIKCPVNVFVYDEEGNLVVNITDNIIEYCADGIEVCISESEKYIAVPADREYDVKIIATDNGTMDYAVREYDESAQLLRKVEKADIPLETDKEFDGTIVNTSDEQASEEDYAITSGNETYIPEEEIIQKDACVINGHTEEIVPGKPATCTSEGLTDGKKCSVCGEILEYQEIIPELLHTPGEWEVVAEAQVGIEGKEQQKCTVCGEVLEERVITALPDVTYIVGDVNGDGKITAADARIILRISAKLDNVENYNIPFEAFDVIVDGKVNAADARKVLRISAKLE